MSTLTVYAHESDGRCLDVHDGDRDFRFYFADLDDLSDLLAAACRYRGLSSGACSHALADAMRAVTEEGFDAGHTDAERIRPASFFLVLGLLLGMSLVLVVGGVR